MIRRGLVALVALVALGACGGTPEGRPSGPGSAAPAASCVATLPPSGPASPATGPVPPGLRSEATREGGTSKGPGARASGASANITAGGTVPDLALACFPGGGEVRLARLGRPTVINIWASWCAPCRKELPAFESYARRAGPAVVVVGVVTETSRAAAQSIIDDLGLTFPMLYDRDKTLLRAVERVNLPLTLFVDAHGRLVQAYQESVLDAAAIERLAGQYLGVAVAG